MSKSDLIEKIAEKSNITKSAATEIVNTILASLNEALKNSEDVSLVGFGTFSVQKREERMGRDPKTGSPITIAARNVVKFKPASGLKSLINQSPDSNSSKELS
ncbi:hypothetical protein CHS0354_023898 [Potamilus streckersoni]|uniref:DNA-binding protein HU n=1 Tax=Potamilus streckersoni TaxID=2493646 RepID=A0AAE0RZV7_9BIVA|nr:hypothetical protein CHS0354_023898 [Potamilus streckersoni]